MSRRCLPSVGSTSPMRAIASKLRTRLRKRKMFCKNRSPTFDFIYYRLRKDTQASHRRYRCCMGGNFQEGGATHMAIAHILGRLAHFNSARDKSGEGWRVSGGQRDSQRPRTSIGRVLGRALLRCIGILRWTVMLAVLALIGWGVNYE